MERKEFRKGIPTGCEIIAKSLLGQYEAAFNATLKGFEMRLDLQRGKGEVLKKLFGGVMYEHHADVIIGTVGWKYFALQFNMGERVTEKVLSDIPMEEWEEWGIGPGGNLNGIYPQRDCLNACTPLRGSGYRKHLQEAIKNIDWKTMETGQYAIAVEKNLCQVNDMDDMLQQIEERGDNGGNDMWDSRMVYIEGITECEDEDIENYDYFNEKPEGHRGGGFLFDDEDPDLDYGYDAPVGIESCSCVWLLRGKTKAMFINAEGHNYSKYLLLPLGWRDMYKKETES